MNMMSTEWPVSRLYNAVIQWVKCHSISYLSTPDTATQMWEVNSACQPDLIGSAWLGLNINFHFQKLK
jgi:hypothetical protein